jgi:hypothetical protein
MTVANLASSLLKSLPVPAQLRQSSAFPGLLQAATVGRGTCPSYSGRYGRALRPGYAASRR